LSLQNFLFDFFSLYPFGNALTAPFSSGAIQAISIQPSLGPQGGQTLITLTGSGFIGIPSDQIALFRCTFEDSLGVTRKSKAWILSDSMLSCQTPPQSVKCIAQVGAVVDELAVTVAAIFFQYYGVHNFLASVPMLNEMVWVAL
jgi:hypothetical protein